MRFRLLDLCRGLASLWVFVYHFFDHFNFHNVTPWLRGIIRVGFNPELDRLRELRSTGRGWIATLEAEERTRTGISSLKIKFNSVLGFFFEVLFLF